MVNINREERLNPAPKMPLYFRKLTPPIKHAPQTRRHILPFLPQPYPPPDINPCPLHVALGLAHAQGAVSNIRHAAADYGGVRARQKGTMHGGKDETTYDELEH